MNTDQFTRNGNFLMLALDHRESLLKMLETGAGESATKDQAIRFKRAIINSLAGQFSGLLIDAGYGLPAYDNHTVPFLLPLEKSGYTDKAGERLTELQYPATQLKELGASGAKLLIYFNPRVTSAATQIDTAKRALNDAHSVGLPLFLEIVTYEPSGAEPDKVQLVPESVQTFLAHDVRPDVFKLEYPLDEAVASGLTTTLGQTPWIVLTGGQDFTTFASQLTAAKAAGARGFLAGRALWQEACKLQGAQFDDFIRTTLVQRFQNCVEIFS